MRIRRTSPLPSLGRFDPDLLVAEYVATRRGDPERGPQIRLHPEDARMRLLQDGELVWIHGPRTQQIAPLVIDETVARNACVLRDVGGVDLSEKVRVSKPDFDTPRREGLA